MFRSVGLAFQDLAACWQVYPQAKALGVGIEIEL
jgi:ornithine cyclodeaminase/alanine dehydrogenase-like protein (mu-crystallin family)